jgi:chromosome segregation ATPase
MSDMVIDSLDAREKELEASVSQLSTQRSALSERLAATEKQLNLNTGALIEVREMRARIERQLDEATAKVKPVAIGKQASDEVKEKASANGSKA